MRRSSQKRYQAIQPWEDYIVWKNKEKYVNDLKARLESFPHHFHEGKENNIMSSHLDADMRGAFKEVLEFIRTKLKDPRIRNKSHATTMSHSRDAIKKLFSDRMNRIDRIRL